MSKTANPKGRPCKRKGYCCAISPRCEECPKFCVEKQVGCQHWETCPQFESGAPQPVVCDECGKLLHTVNSYGEWELDAVRGFSDDKTKQYLFCLNCVSKKIDFELKPLEGVPAPEEVHQHYQNVIEMLIKTEGAFLLGVTTYELIILRLAMALYIVFPGLKEEVPYAIRIGKRIIAKIDKILLQRGGISRKQIVTIVAPNSQSELEPILQQAMENETVYDLVLDPYEFVSFYGALTLIKSVKSAILEEYTTLIPIFDKFLRVADAKLRKLGFSDQELVILKSVRGD